MEFGFLSVEGGDKLQFADQRAGQLLGFADSEQLRLHWGKAQGILDEAIHSPETRTEIDVEIGEGQHRVVVAYRLDQPDRQVFVLTTDACADDDRLHATQLRSMAALRRSIEHDFRSSLNALSLNIELLRGDVVGADLARNYDRQLRSLEVLAREIARLPESLNRILGRLEPLNGKIERFELSKVVQEVADLIGAQARLQHLRVNLAIPQEAIFVTANRGRLRQALINLCVNAVQAMPTGGTLDIGLTLCDECAVMTVRDDGPGLSTAYLAEVGRIESAVTGNGSGLCVANAAVEQLGGMMHIESAANAGTKIELRIPVAPGS